LGRELRPAVWDDLVMDLAALHGVANERHAAWSEAGAQWAIEDGPVTDKPASWLDLTTNSNSGRLILWTSGEAEMEWGTKQVDGQRHYDLDGPTALRDCIDDLERVVGLR
jgi:hypothetical protein